ncbi:VOC family protein [Streptococcus macacae]|uniref:Glyoxalase family protein n=1 Tax=Streptococcus macacae NCTC 11558 TaxID=764298 RepID=G5JYB6_9STRE|nr:VOC family protein [Streptococcus macacae]EHJ51738.1 glyoxalase family protein [Streptococcus macacae NCTC 11558]SUN78030.1 putative glyoxalase [Streptococcus macacae NCTC 11558]
MIDHFGITVKNLENSKAFYQATLAPLGYELKCDSSFGLSFAEACSTDPAGDFWIRQGEKFPPMHFAFNAQTREKVRAFYQAGLKAGAADNGAPGIRKKYHSNYYAAFLLDPDGHNIEAVCHKKE